MCLSQDFSHYTLGDKALKNAEIYSVLQTKDLRLYIATNEGLYRYKNGKMNVLKSERQKGTSLFNLRENSKGEVFCYNLNGQIFKVNNNELLLFAQIPIENIGAIMSMEIDQKDNLIFGSKGCLLLSENYTEVIYKNDEQATPVSKLTDGRIFIGYKQKDNLLEVKNGKLVSQSNSYLKSSNSKNLIYAFNEKLIGTNKLNSINNGTNQRLTSLTQYFQFDNKSIWRKSHVSGVEKLVFNKDKIIIENKYFTDTFISTIAKGQNGDLFFGTFEKGLLVVPNSEMINNKLNRKAENIQSIAATKSGKVFISDRINGVLVYDNFLIEKTEEALDYIPENVFTTDNYNTGLSKNNPLLFYNSNLFPGALKNIDNIDDHTLLLSTSEGVFKLGPKDIISDSIWTPLDKNDKGFKLNGINYRCMDAIYMPEEEAIYIATISFLLRIDKNGINKVRLNNEDVIANDLHRVEDEIWIATQKKGILIFKNLVYQNTLNTKNGLENNFIKKLGHNKDLILISTKTGFQIYNKLEKKWHNIGTAEGLERSDINDFAISDKRLWLATNNRLLSISTDKLKPTEIELKFSLDSIYVSGKNILESKNKSFRYNQNKLKIVTDFRLISLEDEAYYEFQLEGFDKKVRRLSVIEPSINYDYLPPGDYTFSIKAKYRDSVSPSMSFSFSIQKAYWKTWWFYSIISILIFSIILSYVLLRDKRLKSINEEKLYQQFLKTNYIESELKALRSQMNPHFIFNSLNSIQDLILKKDTESSYDYIVLFSDLVRNSLNYSNKGYITLENETAFLKTYLKLEKLRFGNLFNYEILNNCDCTIKIPSLIIQPFVENAIVHGLFHKKGEKKLSIVFTSSSTGIKCEIIDNGVGRKRANNIQLRQGTKKDSYAMNAIRKRMKILGEKHNKIIDFKIIDLDLEDKSTGTKIIIDLPILNY